MAEVESEAVPGPASRWRGALGWAAAIVFAFLGLLGWQRFLATNEQVEDLRRQVAELEADLKDVGVDMIRLRQELDGVRSSRATLVASTLEIVPLGPATDDQPAPAARVAYDPGTETAVAFFRDATAPAGRAFQLWALRDGSVKSLGVLAADPSGRLELAIDLAGAGVIRGFAVSLEPEGGSPDPTAPSGPVVAVGMRG